MIQFSFATLGLLTLIATGETAVGGPRNLKAMTVNLYVGSGTERILALDPGAPGYLTNLVATVTGIYYEILASQPPARLDRVAAEIAEEMPDLVSVQEASLIRIQSPGDLVTGGSTPATNVVFDYLEILTQALAAKGAHYSVVSSREELDVELPLFNLQTGTIDDARLTDRDAILVRTDLPVGIFHVVHTNSGTFANVIQIPTLGLSVRRGWCSVDATSHGKRFRYICTHLEEETAPQIQLLQAGELLDGPANVKIPVIIAGDFNADPLHRNGTVSYDSFIGAGFRDAWAALHPADLSGGLTWGHDELLADPTTQFAWRIDQVLTRGSTLVPIKATTVDMGLEQDEPPLWASDHAAVAVEIRFQPAPHRMLSRANAQ